jgi:hypothetical protein
MGTRKKTEKALDVLRQSCNESWFVESKCDSQFGFMLYLHTLDGVNSTSTNLDCLWLEIQPVSSGRCFAAFARRRQARARSAPCAPSYTSPISENVCVGDPPLCSTQPTHYHTHRAVTTLGKAQWTSVSLCL